jgi:hypothetical protein
MSVVVGSSHGFGEANLHPKLRNDPGGVHMTKRVETQSSMRRVILFATVASGFVAAYLMYRRGESLGSIAKQTITNPVGSLVSEVKTRANG